MRASDWGDRITPFLVIRPPVTLAQHEATKREIAAGWRVVPQQPDTSIDWSNAAKALALGLMAGCLLLLLRS